MKEIKHGFLGKYFTYKKFGYQEPKVLTAEDRAAEIASMIKPWKFQEDTIKPLFQLAMGAQQQGTPTPTMTPSSTPAVSPTQTPTPTPTPSATPPTPFDPDAAAYLAAVIDAGGSVDATISGATETLFLDLKSNSLYSKLIAFYPVLGGVQASHAINGNMNATYDISYNGAWTHSISGQTSPNGGYGLTNYIIPSG